MTQPALPPNGSIPLSRRHLMRLGAAAAGAPLFACNATQAAGGPPTSQRDPEASPVLEAPDLPGEDHPEARARTVENLIRIGIAMNAFPFHTGRFPPAAICKDGEPLLSWRVAILPFLDVHRGAQLYRKFRLDEPWDSEHNSVLLKEMPPEYAPVAGKHPPEYCTYYQVFTGPGALFDGEEGTNLADVTDGVGSTLMVVEAAEPVPWTRPSDLPYETAMPLPKLGGQFEDGFYVAFADGSARFLSKNVASETLRALILRGDGEVIPFGKLGPWRRLRPRASDSQG